MTVATLRALVLDVDDTLYLERDYVRSGFLAVGAWVRGRFEVDDFADRAWTLFAAGIRGEIFDRVVADLGLSPELVPSLIKQYREHRPNIEMLPDAGALLDRLQGRAALAVVTDGPLDSQRRKVSALGIAPRLAALVLTAELGPDYEKPNPRAFELVEQITGSQGSESVYVADNPVKDFAGPKSLGWRTVRVRRPLGLHVDAPSGPDVDFEVQDLTRLEAVMGLAVPAGEPK